MCRLYERFVLCVSCLFNVCRFSFLLSTYIYIKYIFIHELRNTLYIVTKLYNIVFILIVFKMTWAVLQTCRHCEVRLAPKQSSLWITIFLFFLLNLIIPSPVLRTPSPEGGCVMRLLHENKSCKRRTTLVPSLGGADFR